MRRLTALLAALWLGCSTPTEPGDIVLTTPHGNVTVVTNGYPFDAAQAEAAIVAGFTYATARTSSPARVERARVDGMRVVVAPGPGYGQYDVGSDTARVTPGWESVLRHELQHRLCHHLGNSGACCTLQDHAGGFDLDCQRSA